MKNDHNNDEIRKINPRIQLYDSNVREKKKINKFLFETLEEKLVERNDVWTNISQFPCLFLFKNAHAIPNPHPD